MTCQRCGHCCWSMPKDFWKDGLSAEEISTIEAERLNYPEVADEGGSFAYCGMFAKIDDIAVCLPEKILGKKPKECSNFTGFQFCGKDGLLPPKQTTTGGV